MRALLARLDRPSSSWEVSGSATPSDLSDRLERLGLVPHRDAYVVGMVLSEPSPPAPPGIVVRPVATADEYVAALGVQHEAFETPAAARERELADAPGTSSSGSRRPTLRSTSRGSTASRPPPVARRSPRCGVVLNGGATLPRFRGSGAYRALVAARWEDAVRRGTPALVTQAGAMSRPILRRLGFREVAEIRVLIDDPARTAGSGSG